MATHGGRARGRPKAFHDKSDTMLIQSLDRAVTVLKTVSAGSGLSLTEIAEAAGQSPSTVYRILNTLKSHRIVDYDEVGQLWHVGLEAFRIGSSFLGRTRIVEQSRPVMQRIMAATGETANLAIIDGGEVIFISQVETHEPIRAFFRPGTRGPIHASGIGKALLAFRPADEIDRTLSAAPFKTFTAKTIADREAMLAELKRIAARGFAVDDEERTVGMRCIAAPIFNPYGEAVAGISLSGPTVRIEPEREEEYGAMVRSAADEITRAMGGAAPRRSAFLTDIPANDHSTR